VAHYLVKAKFYSDLLAELRARLDSGEIRQMRPFGTALHGGLDQGGLDRARLDEPGWAVWEEEDYCTPPLAMERAAVLDTYFTELSVERVSARQGWTRIESLPKMWADPTTGESGEAAED